MSEPSPAKRRWIIDEVLPHRVIALLVGPTGSSKSSWMAPTLVSIKKGESIFGRRVEPTSSVWISCDRSKEEYESHMSALGIPPGEFPFHDQTAPGSETTVEFVIKRCSEAYPNNPLLFIDGFARLIPGGKISDYSVVADFLCSAGAAARKYNRTVIGCLHAGKERDGSGYANPRDQVCGSTAWVGFSNLTLVLQRDKPKEPEDPIRKLHVLARGAHGDKTYRYRKLESGILIPEDDPVEDDMATMITAWLEKQPFDQPIPTAQFIEIGKNEASISRATVERWIKKSVENLLIERVSKGIYRRVQVQ